MPRVVSFIALLAIVLLVGAVFFQVMAQFLVPLFLASVLLVIFRPLHIWIRMKMPRHPRVAAMCTTITIMLVVLLPTLYLGWKAFEECRGVYHMISADAAANGGDRSEEFSKRINEGATDLLERYKKLTGKELNIENLLQQASNMMGAFLLGAVGYTISILFSLAIMIIALYYFLADGPGMVRALMKLSPLEQTYEEELLENFGSISRSVVLATFLSAVAQGLVAGIGYWFVLPSNAPVFLLVALTMVLAIVPFIGAAGVWVPVCLGLLVLGDGPVGSHWPAAVGLAIYCGVFVSVVDNVLKPYVLKGQANLHPLLALLSIIGGVHVLGAVGILVGPMLVSFLQALLNMLHKELEIIGKAHEEGIPLAEAAEAVTNALEEAHAKEAEDDEKPADKPAKKKTPAKGKK